MSSIETSEVDSSKSCIVCQFAHYAPLTDAQVQLLESLEKHERKMSAGESIRSDGAPANEFFTVKAGWVIAEQNLKGGQRQIVDVFFPGQILGLREIAYKTALCSYTCLTDVVICPFPKSRVNEVFDKSKRLTDLLFLVLAREQATLVERVVNLGRRSAIEKVAHFLLEVSERLSITNDVTDHRFRLPMTQRNIADTLGLSAVHVSRSFSKLNERRMVCREGDAIELLDKAGLERLAGFDHHYLDLDVDWIRQDEESNHS